MTLTRIAKYIAVSDRIILNQESIHVFMYEIFFIKKKKLSRTSPHPRRTRLDFCHRQETNFIAQRTTGKNCKSNCGFPKR